jgi:eukaryotic-like serine/threonine-protein kinase
MKVLPASLASDPQFFERFDREARTISQPYHPQICALYDVGGDHDAAFLVMQYLEGETLADRLKKAALPSKRLSRSRGRSPMPSTRRIDTVSCIVM